LHKTDTMPAMPPLVPSSVTSSAGVYLSRSCFLAESLSLEVPLPTSRGQAGLQPAPRCSLAHWPSDRRHRARVVYEVSAGRALGRGFHATRNRGHVHSLFSYIRPIYIPSGYNRDHGGTTEPERSRNVKLKRTCYPVFVVDLTQNDSFELHGSVYDQCRLRSEHR